MVIRLIGRASLWAIVATLFGCFFPGESHAQSSLPDPSSTPGATNPAVTQANIGVTICVPGWTRTIRPPSKFTSALKRQQLRSWWSYGGGRMRDYEEDHLIPLELGGAPADPHNLWPEPRHPADGWNADLKDGLERALNRLVCDGSLPLVEAQRAIAGDWRVAYRWFVIGSAR